MHTTHLKRERQRRYEWSPAQPHGGNSNHHIRVNIPSYRIMALLAKISVRPRIAPARPTLATGLFNLQPVPFFLTRRNIRLPIPFCAHATFTPQRSSRVTAPLVTLIIFSAVPRGGIKVPLQYPETSCCDLPMSFPNSVWVWLVDSRYLESFMVFIYQTCWYLSTSFCWFDFYQKSC